MNDLITPEQLVDAWLKAERMGLGSAVERATDFWGDVCVALAKAEQPAADEGVKPHGFAPVKIFDQPEPNVTRLRRNRTGTNDPAVKTYMLAGHTVEVVTK